MIRKFAALVLLATLAFPAEKDSTTNLAHRQDVVSAFLPFPKPLQQLILDYYGKHWVVECCTINYHRYVESPHPTLQALEFEEILPRKEYGNNKVSLTGYFATDNELIRCTYIKYSIPSCELVHFNTRAFKKESESVWQARIPAKAPDAFSECGMYKAYVCDFKLPYGGTHVRVLKKEEDENYACLAAMLALDEREKAEDSSFDMTKEKFVAKDA